MSTTERKTASGISQLERDACVLYNEWREIFSVDTAGGYSPPFTSLPSLTRQKWMTLADRARDVLV